MSTSEDVSWHTLRRIARLWAGESAEIEEVRHLHGGAVANTLGLTLSGGKRAALKIAPHRVDRSMAREAQQLNHLRMLGVPVPQVYGWRLADLDSPDSFLLMEFVEGIDLAAAREKCSPEQYERLQEDLARIVLTMHSQTAEMYMRVGAIGPEGEPCASWPEFFRRVYEGMWRDLEKDPHTSKSCRKAFNRVHDALPRLVSNLDRPRLVHWDLWTANVLVRREGEQGDWKVAAILDPMCKYAHAEAELAYLEMFQTVTPAFLRVYRQQLRPPEEYFRLRRGVYQLYFLMDHAAFFGGPYHGKFEEAATKLAAEI